MSGESLYLELEYKGEVSDFVEHNVLPHLEGNKIKKEEAVDKIMNGKIGNLINRVLTITKSNKEKLSIICSIADPYS